MAKYKQRWVCHRHSETKGSKMNSEALEPGTWRLFQAIDGLVQVVDTVRPWRINETLSHEHFCAKNTMQRNALLRPSCRRCHCMLLQILKGNHNLPVFVSITISFTNFPLLHCIWTKMKSLRFPSEDLVTNFILIRTLAEQNVAIENFVRLNCDRESCNFPSFI